MEMAKGTAGTVTDMLILHTIGMEYYQGYEQNIEEGSFQFALQNGYGYEMFNFRRVGGVCYGYAPVSHGTININRLGAQTRDKSISDILVVWTEPVATGGKRVVGWYRNAEVFRKYQPGGGLQRTYRNRAFQFVVRAKASDCLLLRPKNRNLPILQKYRCSYFPRQNSALYRQIRRYIARTKTP